MSIDTLERKKSPQAAAKEEKGVEWVMIRIDQKDQLPSVVPHALAVAAGLGRHARFIEVVDPAHLSAPLVDPVDWDISKHETQLHLESLVDHYKTSNVPIEIQVLERYCPEDIKDFNLQTPPILAFGRYGTELPWHLDKDNWLVADISRSSILMVPDIANPLSSVSYKRIVVPLDGSCRAEAALPIALDMATFYKAELVLLHVTPETPLMRNDLIETGDKDLENLMKERNERVAQNYLKTVCERCRSTGLTVNTHVIAKGEVRRQLLEMTNRINADLIVLNSHGAGGYSDVLSGSVASFVLEHSSVPVLMVGQGRLDDQKTLFLEAQPNNTRLPGVAPSTV